MTVMHAVYDHTAHSVLRAVCQQSIRARSTLKPTASASKMYSTSWIQGVPSNAGHGCRCHNYDLDQPLDRETGLDIFRVDPDYEKHEAEYKVRLLALPLWPGH